MPSSALEPPPSSASPSRLTALHQRRLAQVWRSAGWPCLDAIELDLLAVGCLSRHWDEQGRQTLRVTDQGIQVLAAKRRRHQAALSAHEGLVGQVVREMHRAGRVVWRGLSLRAPLPAESGATQWALAMPDVFSIRHTSVEDYAEPVVHEIKVSRSDLRADLQKAHKGAAYLALSSQCWYVLARGIADLEEVPVSFGVMLADEHGLEVARPAPRRAMRLPFVVWIALARAAAELHEDSEQCLLGSESPPSSGLAAEEGLL